MEIHGLKLYKIDSKKQDLECIDSEHITEDFQDYCKALVSGVLQNENSRRFNLRRETTEVYSLIKNAIYNSDFENSSASIARRLLEEEISTLEKMSHLHTEIQKGILLQAHVKHENFDKHVICKAEDTEVIAVKDFLKTRGYPIKKKIFKSFYVEFNEDKNPSIFKIYDTNERISKFWWDGFLELNHFWDDKYNTEKAFSLIDGKILSRCKKDYPSDYMQLRNATITLFRTKEEFSIEEYIDEVIRPYKPVKESLDIKDLVERIKLLPERFDFDRRFTIVPNAIRAKIRTVVPLTEQIELHLKQDLDIRNTIFPERSLEGEKFIKIRTDKGYDTFLQRIENNGKD